MIACICYSFVKNYPVLFCVTVFISIVPEFPVFPFVMECLRRSSTFYDFDVMNDDQVLDLLLAHGIINISKVCPYCKSTLPLIRNNQM